MSILEIISIVFISIGIVYLLIDFIYIKKNNNYPKKERNSFKNPCILIPARDESSVIEDLLISIENQTKKINMENVFIIVEDKNDRTVEIAKKHHASIFIRKNLNLQRKGYALDEIIKEQVKNNIYFDLYFIIDADNILDKNFLSEMNKTYIKGYDVGIGYRNIKNGNDSVVAACSGLTFSFLNSNSNATKNNNSKNVILSGTGLYIDGNLIKKWKSFPFHSLTEDYELTLYSILNNLTSFYNRNAIFYDEQPIYYKNTVPQRVRWIKGYFTSRKKYIPLIRRKLKNDKNNYGSKISEIIGMKPYIYMIIGAFIYILNGLFILLTTNKTSYIIKAIFQNILTIFLFIYVLLMILTIFVLYKEKNKIKLNRKTKIKSIFYCPIFFSTYIGCALRALFNKNVKWEKIVHNRKLDQ